MVKKKEAVQDNRDFVPVLNRTILSRVDAMNTWLKRFGLSLDRIVAALFASLMLSYVFQLTVNGDFGNLSAYYNQINFMVFIPIAVVAFSAMILLTVRMGWKRLIPALVLILCAEVSVLWITLYTGEDKGYFALGVGIFDLIVLLWLFQENKLGIPGTDKIKEELHALGEKLHQASAALEKPLGKTGLSIGGIITALLASLVLAHVYQLITAGEFETLKDYFAGIGAAYFLIALGAFAVLLLLTAFMKLPYLCSWALLAFTLTANFLLAFQARGYSDDNGAYYALGIGTIDLVLILWLVHGDKLGVSSVNISRRTALIAAAVMFAATTAAFGWFTSLKYHNYSTYTFDFGIFAQMFERMAETGQPFTTVERSYMMLHYGVHFSPFFYLFLPGYYLFRSPIYLYFIQAAGVAAGVFAVWLLCGKLGLSGKATLALEMLYILYPSLFNGTFYDFHENKFLTAVILFLFYFIVSKKPVGIFIFSLMLLSIKEDAAIYLMVIAAFVIINRKEIFTGVVMLLMAIVYFVAAQRIVAASGLEGVMMTRLQDYFINGEQTFGSVAKAVIFDLGHTLGQMFTAEKIPFVIWMFAPVLFAPFMTKKISSLILLLPILPINLMQSWQYQYNIDYQYTYGVAALIFVSAIFVLVRLRPAQRRVLLLTSLCICMVMSVTLNAPKIRTVTKNAADFEASYDQVDEVLSAIPDGATVTACDAFVPHLYKVKWLFTAPDYYKTNWNQCPIKPYETDYIVLDTRYRNNENRGQYLSSIMGNNYRLIKSGGFAELYERKVKIEVRE